MPTIYVKKTGDDGNPGTDPAAPKLTIKSAVENATNLRDIVEILDQGTYVENPEIEVKANAITLIHTASELGRPILNASGIGSAPIFVLSNPNSQAGTKTDFRIIGLEIQGSGDSSTMLLKIHNNNTNANGLKIDDCFIYNIPCIHDGFLQVSAGESITIEKSSFMFNHHGTRPAIRYSSGGTTGKFLIENCFLSRSGDNSEKPILASNNSSNPCTASFCTFVYNNVASNPAVISLWGKAINCVVSASGPNVIGIDAADHTFNISNALGRPYGNGSGGADSAGTGDLDNSAGNFIQFVDGTSTGNTLSVVQNYALAEGSPGLDVGTSFNGVSVDILGVARPQGTGFDMGAFERVVPYWQDADNGETYSTKFGGSFEIHGTANKLATRIFPRSSDNRQAPYFVTISGPPSLRGRTPNSDPYKVET